MTESPPLDPSTATGIDSSVPHSARIWNYWLGGKDNYAVDREAGDAWLAVQPEMAAIAQESRAFLRRSVRHLVTEVGIRQFLDVGTGLPTADNTHEVAQQAAPDARIVYVDHDPLVLTHARALLTSSPQGATRYLDADIREADKILSGASEILDLSRPVALLLMGVLGHVVDDAEARSVVANLLDPLPSGSYLVICDGSEGEAVSEAEREYAETGAVPYNNRTAAQVSGFFDGLELVEPGFVSVSLWRPDERAIGADVREPVNAFAGVGRKR